MCGYRVPEHAHKGIGGGGMLHLVLLATVICGFWNIAMSMIHTLYRKDLLYAIR